jgi:acylphosphatase
MPRHLLIHGRVQGVGYREFMRREAARLGVTGWVRNRRDGTVEAVIAGHDDAIVALTAWAHRGPPSAAVTKVDVAAAEGTFADFEVRPTA